MGKRPKTVVLGTNYKNRTTYVATSFVYNVPGDMIDEEEK